MLYVLEYLGVLFVFLTIVGVTGWVLEPNVLARTPLRGLSRFCLGFAFWILGTFGLALAGSLRTGGLLGLLMILGIVATVSWWRPASSWWQRPSKSQASRFQALPVSRADLLFGGMITGLLLPLAILAMSPPVSWDANVYHLALPKLFIQSGGFETPPMSVYAHWPLNTELLFALAILLKDYILAKLLHFAFGALTLWTLFRAGRVIFGKDSSSTLQSGTICGILAAGFFLANPVVAFEMRVAYVELAQAFFTLAAVLFLEHALAAPDRPRALLALCGLCCGLVAGIKVTGIVLAGAITITWLIGHRHTARADPKGTLQNLASLLLPVAMLWLPWLVKTWWETGNPVYPLLHSVFGGPHWTADLATRFAEWQSAIGMGRSPLDYVLLPIRIFLSGGQGYGRFDGELGAFWILVLPAAFWVARKRPDVRRLLGISGLLFVAWALTSQQMRFLIPILPLLALASAIGIAEWVNRVAASIGARRATVAALAVAVLALNVWMHQRYLLAGLKTLKLYNSRPKVELIASAVHPIYRVIDQELPADARLLLLNTNHAFFLERPYIVDSFFEASQLAAWLATAPNTDALSELLNTEAITHLLIEQRDRRIAWPPPLLALLTDPSRVEVVHESADGRFLLLARRPAVG